MNKLVNDLKDAINNSNLENGIINKDDYELYDTCKNQLDVINLFDVVFFTSRGKPKYVRYLKKTNPIEYFNRNFKEILGIAGGVLGVKNKSDPNRIKLLPFIKLDKKIIAPHRFLRSYINSSELHLTDSNSTEDDLNKYMYRTNQNDQDLYSKFTSLMLVYSSVDENENFDFVELEPWLTKFKSNNLFDYTYEYKLDDFPTCWLSKKDINLLLENLSINIHSS